MRWPRPRFTVRRLMITVAILALGFAAVSWVAEMRVRSVAYRRRALEFELETLHWGSAIHMSDGRLVDRYGDESRRLRDAWARGLEAKYLRLSYYPWLAVEPDPPPPQPLARPRSAFELSEHDDSGVPPVVDRRPPAWTFLWTWHPRRSMSWD